MAELGCEVGNNFSPQQLESIELFATGEYNCSQVAEKIGVTIQTISTWRRNYQYMNAICEKAKTILKSHLPEIYKTAAKKAKEGSHQHIKIILDHIENIEKLTKKSNQASFTFTWDLDADSNTI